MKYTTNRPGSIYIFHAEGTNRYKIGRATDVFKRYKTLKRQSAYPLRIIKYLYTLDMVFDESALHQEFKERRVHGEWFEFENQDDALDNFRPHTMLYLISNKENELDKLDLGLNKDSEVLEITFAHCIDKAYEENKYVEYYRVISELIKTSQKNFYYGLDFTSYVIGYLQAAYLYREHDEINQQLAPDY